MSSPPTARKTSSGSPAATSSSTSKRSQKRVKRTSSSPGSPVSVSEQMTRPAMPSLLQFQGATDEFMRLVETWPRTRVNVLEQTRELLQSRFEAKSRDISTLKDWFANIVSVGAGSAFGEVSKACIRAWNRSTMTPLVPPMCVQYTLSDLGAGESEEPHSLYLIVKTMKAFDVKRYKGVPYAAHDEHFTTWDGSQNPVREVAMGRLLNVLVQIGATPHFPLIYEPFRIMDTRRTAFTMELAHMSFKDFLQSKMLAFVEPDDALELLNVALLQICQGLLCAQEHYDFRHNDLHAENAMMTFISDSTYNYKVGDTFYSIPNYGMCWKVIDFGLSASGAFDKHDIAYTYMHSDMAMTLNFDLDDHAVEFYDFLSLTEFSKGMLGLMRAAGSEFNPGNMPASTASLLIRQLNEWIDMMKAIAMEYGVGHTLQMAADENEKHQGAPELASTTASFSESMHSVGLLKVLFERFAVKYRARRQPRGVIFDSSASPYSGGNIILEGIASEPIVFKHNAKSVLPVVS